MPAIQDQPARDIVLQFCSRLSDRDFDGMRRLVTDDMTWLVPGLQSRIPWAGLFSFNQIRVNLEGFLGSMDEFRFEVVDTTAERHRVTVEARSHGILSGVTYANIYLMQYTLRDDRICSLQEFLDQSRVADFEERLAAADG